MKRLTRIFLMLMLLTLVLSFTAPAVFAANVVERGWTAISGYYTLYDDGTLIFEHGDASVVPYTVGGPLWVKKVVLNSRCGTISNNAFAGYHNLTSVELNGAYIIQISDRSFQNCTSLTNLSFPSVQYIGDYAFENCTALTEFVLPESLQSIGTGAFSGCSGLKTMVIPEDVEYIFARTFENCTSLTSVTLSEETREIEEAAFKGCSSLTSITIPKSTFSIGDEAFPSGKQFTVYGYRGTEAEAFAARNDNTFVPLNKSFVTASIPEHAVSTAPLRCGSVMLPSGTQCIEPQILLTPTEGSVAAIQVQVDLPEGFSFVSHDTLSSKTFYVGGFSSSTPVPSVRIYPIYLSEDDIKDAYSLTVTITGITDMGEDVNESYELEFYRPESTTTGAVSDGPALSSQKYTFSLDSATGSASTYNQGTARLAALLADLAYDDKAMEDFLATTLGFSNYEEHGIFNLNARACGRYIASKKIIEDGQVKNLVYVVCRGTAGWGTEWIGNLQVGIMGQLYDHVGFAAAADYVKEDLAAYCKAHSFTKDNTVILVTGHSKGAAAANLVGQWLNASAGLANPGNVSVYTFATPTVNKTIASEGAGYTGNENIFNFVNYQDMIRNAPSMQYYGRYGSTRYFAFRTAQAGSAVHNDGYGTYDLPGDGQTYTMLELLNGIVHAADTSSPKSVFAAAYRLLNIQDVIVHHYSSSAVTFLGEVLNAHSMAGYYQAVTQNASSASVADINARTATALNYYDNVVSTLWMDHPEDVMIHKFKCPVNIYVTDSAGNTAASIVDKQVTCSDPNLLVWVDGDALMVGCLQGDWDSYDVRIEGYDNGTMAHTILSGDDQDIQQVQQRTGIPITDGGSLELNSNGHVSLPGESQDAADNAYQQYDTPEAIDQFLTQADTHTHAYGDWTVVQQPTAQQDGTEERRCECGDTETRSIPKYTNPFQDVSSSDYFFTPVLWAAREGITSGTTRTTFSPNDVCTRGQVVTFLWRAAGQPEPSSSDNPFTDVNPSDFYYKAVLWAVEKGITNGMSPTQFGPGSPCTRGQVATFLHRAQDAPEPAGSNNPFTDVSPADYYYKAVLWAVENGITNGVSATQFGPGNPCSRAQIVTFLYRTLIGE